MSRETNPDSTSEAFFDRKYRDNPDPWNFAASPYEQSRYEAIVRALGQRQYQRCFEPGCSVGVLTARLACFCGQVEALDIAPAAVERARTRCLHLQNVRVLCGALPWIPGEGGFDLIVLSEIGYYFAQEPLAVVADALVQRLEPGGILLAAHWLGCSPDHLLGGEQVHALLRQVPGLRHEHHERHGQGDQAFLLDRWVRRAEVQ
jgi:SAM-dependent methyltransferase